MALNRLKTHQKIFLFSVLAVALIAIFDIWSMNSGVFGTIENYISGNYTPGWWTLFFKINIAFLVLISVFYYFFVRKDFSESVSFFVSSTILWFTGLSDIFFFLFRRLPVSQTLDWLNNHIVIGKVTILLGFSDVTSTALFISTFLGLIISYCITKILVEKF